MQRYRFTTGWLFYTSISNNIIHVIHKKYYTFSDEDHDTSRLSITGAARIIARVGIFGTPDGQSGLTFGPRLRIHRYPTPGRVIVDHTLVVVPEHVLRRRRTLQTSRNITYIMDIVTSRQNQQRIQKPRNNQGKQRPPTFHHRQKLAHLSADNKTRACPAFVFRG